MKSIAGGVLSSDHRLFARAIFLPCFVALIVSQLCFRPACAADQTTISREQIEALIRELNANTLAERSHAERQLLEIGPEVLPFLPSPDLIDNISAREAVRRIRPQLERRAARDSSASSFVTLRGELPLQQVLEQIQRQTKNRLVVVADAAEIRSVRLQLDWEKRPFWDCIDDLCEKAQLRWNLATDDAAIKFSKAVAAQRTGMIVQRSGPFRLSAEDAVIRPIVGDDQHRILRVTAAISIEPRLRPLFLAMAAKDLSATVDDGQSLANWTPEAKYEFPVGDGRRQVHCQWDFRLPNDTKAETVSIRGRMRCEIAAATERIVFDQKSLTRGAMRRRGGVTVRIRNIHFDAIDLVRPNCEIAIVVGYDHGGPAFESHRSWIFHNAAYLETKDGVRTAFNEFDVTQQTDGAIAVEYRWKSLVAPSDQYRFVYEAPTLIVDTPIDVELDHVRISK